MLSTRCCSHAWYASNPGFTGFTGFTSAFSAWATWAAWALVCQWGSLNVVVLASDSPDSPDSPRISRGVWCPPLPSTRPANCSRQSSQVGQGTAVRSLYDEVAETMAPLSDLLELGEVEDHMLNAYLGLTEFLQNMQHLICFMDFKDNCYENSEYMEVVQYFCHHLDNICHDLGLCKPEMNICGSLLLDAGVDLGRVIQQIRASVLEQVQMNDVPLSASKFIDRKNECLPRSPVRILGLNGSLQILSQEERPLFTRHRILETMSSSNLSGLQSYVVNLGASEMAGCLDSASCLIQRGWSGIMLECNYQHSQNLRETYAHRKDVQIINQCLAPESWVSAAISAVWNFERVLPPTSSPFPMFLKIDVDNGDCDFLKAWLSAGYRPLFVEMELIHAFVPPEIQVNFPYIDVGQADFNKARASDVMSKGCSLGQVLSILGDGYSLLSWSYDKDINAQFVLDTWAKEHKIFVVPHSEISSFWHRAVSFREVWDDHNWHGMDLPLNFLLSDSSLAEKQTALNVAYEIVLQRSQ